MSEESGQKGQDEKVSFDSANIGKKQKATQFTIIEGAEERAKAAERAKIEAEKEAEELHEADIEAASANQAKAEEEQRMATAGLGYKIFGGKRKWIILGIILLITAAILSWFLLFKKPEPTLAPKDAAKAFYDQQAAKISPESTLDDHAAAQKEFLDKIEGLETDEERYYYTIYYTKYLKDIEGDATGALDSLQKAYSLQQIGNYDKCLFAEVMSDVYMGLPLDIPEEYLIGEGCE